MRHSKRAHRADLYFNSGAYSILVRIFAGYAPAMLLLAQFTLLTAANARFFVVVRQHIMMGWVIQVYFRQHCVWVRNALGLLGLPAPLWHVNKSSLALGVTVEIEFLTASLINLLINLSYSILALVVGVYGLLWVDDKLLKNIDLEEEMKKGNVAVAIFASTILIFVALIIAFGFRG